MKKLLQNKILFAVLIAVIFILVPISSIGAMWVQNVGLLPGTSVVFGNDRPVIDKFMAAALKPLYGNRIQICDNTDDQIEINAAVTNLTTGRQWKEVVKTIGHFTLSAPVTITASYVTFDAKEGSFYLETGSNSNVIVAGSVNPAAKINHIDLIGGYINGNGASMPAAVPPVAFNNTGDGTTGGDGICVFGVDDFTVQGWEVYNTYSHMIALYASSHGDVYNNYCHYAMLSHGIDIDYMAVGGVDTGSNEIKVHHNTVIDSGYSCYKTENSTNISITNNYGEQTQKMTALNRRGGVFDMQIDPVPAITQYGILCDSNVAKGGFVCFDNTRTGGSTVVSNNIAIYPIKEIADGSAYVIEDITSSVNVLTHIGNVAYGDGATVTYGLNIHNVAGGVEIKDYTAVGFSSGAGAGIMLNGTCSDFVIDGSTLDNNYYNVLFATGSSVTNVEFWNIEWSESGSANFYSYANGSRVVFRDGTVKNANTGGIGAKGFAFRSGNLTNITWENLIITDDQTVKTQTHALYAHGDYTGTTWIIRGCNLSGNATDVFQGSIPPASSIVERNIGYIATGEHHTASGTLTAGNANAISFAWNNPLTQDIMIVKVVVEVTTAGGTAGSHLDVGIADNSTGTNLGTEFFNDIDLNAAQIDDSWVAGDGGTQTKWVVCQDYPSATDDWVVGQILDANAANLVGKYYIEYVGR